MFSPIQNMTEEIEKKTLVNEELQIHWTSIAPLLTICNEREYNAAVKRLNELGEIEWQKS